MNRILELRLSLLLGSVFLSKMHKFKNKIQRALNAASDKDLHIRPNGVMVIDF